MGSPHRVLSDCFLAVHDMVDPGNAGTITITRDRQSLGVVTAAAETRTLARAPRAGLRFTISMKTDGGDCTVTVTGGYNQAGTTTFVLDDVGDFVAFESVKNGSTIDWRRMGSSGVANADTNTNSGVITFTGNNTHSGNEVFTGTVTPTGGIVAIGPATPGGVVHTQGCPFIGITTHGADLTPTTTSVYVCEIFVPCNMTLTGVKVANGAASANGNITVGLYTAAGAAIAGCLTAATATAGAANSQQAIAFAAPYAAVGPQKFLLGFQYSSATDRPRCHAVGTAFGIVQATSTIGVTAISPLPTAFTGTQQPIASLY